VTFSVVSDPEGPAKEPEYFYWRLPDSIIVEVSACVVQTITFTSRTVGVLLWSLWEFALNRQVYKSFSPSR
jgi:hypothetical protein